VQARQDKDFMSLRSLLCAACCVVSTVLAAGCATLGPGSRTAEQIVLERAQARLDALLERDWARAYPYLTPSYRAIVPRQRYGNQFQGPIQWEEAKAKSAKCEEKRCVVEVEIGARLLLPGHTDRVTSSQFEEIWVLEEGQWFKFESTLPSGGAPAS
jgi:hypothetical protein